MKILSNLELTTFQNRFFKNHKIEWIEISPFRNEQYHKTYHAADGAFMVEINRAVYEEMDFETKGVEIKMTIKLFETECYNSDEAGSVYHYEKY